MLGLHGIQDRPVVIDGEIVIRPMMYIALTYDHRLVDGREAVTFLIKIKERIEDPTRILLEVSGRPREVHLAALLPDGARVMKIDSPLPARFTQSVTSEFAP